MELVNLIIMSWVFIAGVMLGCAVMNFLNRKTIARFIGGR